VVLFRITARAYRTGARTTSNLSVARCLAYYRSLLVAYRGTRTIAKMFTPRLRATPTATPACHTTLPTTFPFRLLIHTYHHYSHLAVYRHTVCLPAIASSPIT